MESQEPSWPGRRSPGTRCCPSRGTCPAPCPSAAGLLSETGRAQPNSPGGTCPRCALLLCRSRCLAAAGKALERVPRTRTSLVWHQLQCPCRVLAWSHRSLQSPGHSAPAQATLCDRQERLCWTWRTQRAMAQPLFLSCPPQPVRNSLHTQHPSVGFDLPPQGHQRALGTGQSPRWGHTHRAFPASPRSLLMLGLNQYFDVSITNFMVGCPAFRGPAGDHRMSRAAGTSTDGRVQQRHFSQAGQG